MSLQPFCCALPFLGSHNTGHEDCCLQQCDALTEFAHYSRKITILTFCFKIGTMYLKALIERTSLHR
jgi:hypothetical protein